MGGEVVGINTETFDGNQDAIKKQQRFLKARVRNTAIFPLTLLPLQESMLPILWHFRPQS